MGQDCKRTPAHASFGGGLSRDRTGTLWGARLLALGPHGTVNRTGTLRGASFGSGTPRDSTARGADKYDKFSNKLCYICSMDFGPPPKMHVFIPFSSHKNLLLRTVFIFMNSKEFFRINPEIDD